MAICKLAQDLLRTTSCGYSLPEISDIYLANYEDIVSTAISAATGETGAEEITAITLSGDAKFFHVEPTKNSVSYTDELVVDDTNGNKYRTVTLNFNVSGMYSAAMHGVLDALSLGRYFAVVKTAEGNYLGLGRVAPLEATTASLGGGGDTNGMTITLSGNVAESAIPLSEGAVDTVLGTGA